MRAERPTVTVDLGPDVLQLLDELVAKLQEGRTRRVTRSRAIRQSIIYLHELVCDYGRGPTADRGWGRT